MRNQYFMWVWVATLGFKSIILIIIKQITMSLSSPSLAQQQTNNYSICTSIVNFIPLDKIGQGSFSSVYKVRRITDDQVYALKKIKIASLKQKQKQNALNQIRILASLNSQYIVQYRQAFFDHKLNLLCIVMEFANDGDLQKKIEGYRKAITHIPEIQVWKAAYHTIKGLSILHAKSILHRDIKSANIFINNGIYKLGDLNVSKVQDEVDKLAYTQTGTPYYASPEVWRDEPYDYKSDIWSLGCLLYQMCTYRPPFKGKDLQTLYRNVQRGLFDPLPIVYSQQLSDFISSCLQLNPKKRPTCKQLLVMPTMKKKSYDLNLSNDQDQLNQQLLRTIKLPTDLRDLRKKLPKSKYSCSIDNIDYKKDKHQVIKKVDDGISMHKKYSHADYYLQLAKKKRQHQNLNQIKINRVISEGSVDKNPEQYYYVSSGKHNIENQRLYRQLTSQSRNIKLVQKQNEECLKEIKSKESTPRSDRSRKKSVDKFNQNQKNKQPSNIDKYKYRISLEKQKQDQFKMRKLSHDHQSPRSGKAILNNISLLKKLSQPAMGKCLSQRYINHDSQFSKQRVNEIQTQRAIRDQKLMKCLLLQKKNEELAQIQKKVEEKRKQLRKIGSIQRLQISNSKNAHNLSYRPNPLILHPNIKKSAAYVSNILLKSPTSTQDESNLKIKQKTGNHKKLILDSKNMQIHKVSSTPYMMGISEAPRMKRILENINQSKKTKQLQIKSKIMSNKYLNKL